MYEHMTFDVIIQRMLDKVPNNMDKRESSPIYNALAPAAVELQLMYIEFDIILQETFGDTASREYLIRRAAERGIQPYPATYALVKCEFIPSTINIPIGSRYSLNNLNYYVKAKIDDGFYQLECEEIGTIGNQYFGDMIPIEYVDGLETVRITELLIPGEDKEDTENLRTRYFTSFNAKSYGGNIHDYLEKTNSIAGVGSTRVTPVWNGGGTVKLTILNSEYNKASSILIEQVQTEIDPTQDGSGIGIAPIGHIVTVDTVTDIEVNISTSIVFEEGYSFNGQKENIITAINEYFLELRKNWADQVPIVRISQIETRLLNLTGIVDIGNTKINDLGENLTLSEYQIPVLGGVIND